MEYVREDGGHAGKGASERSEALNAEDAPREGPEVVLVRRDLE